VKSLPTFFAGLVVLFLMGGCAQGIGQSAPGPQTSATATISATFAAKLTATPPATITPIPPPTRRATSTDLPSPTPGTIIPLLPSFTRMPTERMVTATLSTQSVIIPGLGIFTATPEPLRCDILSTSPNWGQIFPPRTDFTAEWKVYNSGSAMWHVDDILFGFVSGDKMHNLDRGETFLPLTIYAKDKIHLQVRMKSPKEPGTYIATWGLRRSNKKEFFCTFSIMVRVVK
jgi:hypothetical protein